MGAKRFRAVIGASATYRLESLLRQRPQGSGGNTTNTRSGVRHRRHERKLLLDGDRYTDAAKREATAILRREESLPFFATALPGYDHNTRSVRLDRIPISVGWRIRSNNLEPFTEVKRIAQILNYSSSDRPVQRDVDASRRHFIVDPDLCQIFLGLQSVLPNVLNCLVLGTKPNGFSSCLNCLNDVGANTDPGDMWWRQIQNP